MLAVKFHHLRALIHRPYLCLRLLRHPEEVSEARFQNDCQMFDRLEGICVAEASEMAYLLRNVASERELVHDFPWWQMISCLICASSILLVASVFTRRGGGAIDAVDIATLKDDSETCLKVFEALSANSDGARIARDMMARLRDRGLKWSKYMTKTKHSKPFLIRSHSIGDPAAYPDNEASRREQQSVDNVQISVAPDADVASSSHYDALTADEFEMDADGTGAVFGNQDWPSEILDSMTWSAQFFDTVYGSPS